MQLISSLKSREIGRTTGRSRTQRECGKMNLNFALQRLSSQTGDLHMLQNIGLHVPPFACKFCTVSGARNVAAVATEDGSILLLDTTKAPGSRILTSWSTHKNAIFDISWLTGEQKLISASGDCNAALWDVLEKKCLAVFLGHTGTIKCVDICPTQNAVFATGARDSSIRIWDMRSAKQGLFYKSEAVIKLGTLDQPTGGIKSRQRYKRQGFGSALLSVTALAFQNEHHVVSSGSTNGIIKVWDLRKIGSSYKKLPKPLYELYHEGPNIHGFTSLAMDSSRTQLYASCTNSVIYHYDCHTYNKKYVNAYIGHKASSYYVKIALSHDDNYLLSGSGDSFAYIWELSRSSVPLVQLPGHTEEVTAVAWSPEDLKIITCGDDEEVLIWDIFDGHEKEKLETAVRFTATFGALKLANQPVTNSSACEVEELKSATPTLPNRHLVSPEVIVPKKTNPRNSASITEWFSPSGSPLSAKKSQESCTSVNVKASSSVCSVLKDSTISSPANAPSKKRKSDKLDDKIKIIGEVLSPSGVNAFVDGNILASKTNSGVDSSVLSPSKTDYASDSRIPSPSKMNSVVDSRVLSPNKLNSVVDSAVLSPNKLNSVNRVLSPSKAHCARNSAEMSQSRINLNDAFRSEDKHTSIAWASYKVVQDVKNKENVHCSDTSPTRSVKISYTNKSKKKTGLKKNASATSKRQSSGCKSLVSARKGNKVLKKSRSTRKEQKKKFERSIETYFSTQPSVTDA